MLVKHANLYLTNAQKNKSLTTTQSILQEDYKLLKFYHPAVTYPCAAPVEDFEGFAW